MALNEYGDLSPLTVGKLIPEWLAVANPLEVLGPFASGKTLEEHSTTTVTFKRLEGNIDFAFAQAYIEEGVTPLSQQLENVDYTLVLQQMGGLVEHTDILQNNYPMISVLAETFKRLMEQSARVIERDRYNALKANPNKFYSGTATTRGTIIAPVSQGLFDAINRYMMQNLALPITEMQKTGPEVNTISIRAAYVCACSTDLEYDLENMNGWKELADYADGTPTLKGEIGSYKMFRFLISQDLTPYKGAGGAVSQTAIVSSNGTNSDVYPIIIFGQNSWDTVAFKGLYAVKPMALSADVPRGGDPMGQRGSKSWKAMQGTLWTNPAWGLVLECAATYLTGATQA
jgi:N4-gp56 family major capsid protein